MNGNEDILDVIVIGGGFGGIFALQRLRSAGFRALLVEAAGASGVRSWNRAPGARGGADSLQHGDDVTDSQERDWIWPERLATRPGPARYMEKVTARSDLGPHMRVDVRVAAAIYDDAAACWRVETEAGEMLGARFLVMASGALPSPRLPEIPGMAIHGADSWTLDKHWANGPRTYLGLMIAGFPNLFLISGPGGLSVFGDRILSVEHDAEWITRCMADLRAMGARTIAPTPEAEAGWMAGDEALATGTLCEPAESWFRSGNAPGKPLVFMPDLSGADGYERICMKIADDGYHGFLIDGERGERNQSD